MRVMVVGGRGPGVAPGEGGEVLAAVVECQEVCTTRPAVADVRVFKIAPSDIDVSEATAASWLA